MDRTVLVTGSNSGIGLATAIAIAKAGFRSVGTVRNESKARVLAEAAHEAEVEIETRLLDVTDPEACRRVVEEIRPWALVNNAGYGRTAAVEDVGDDEARLMLETMVVAPMRLARLAIPSMRAAGSGRIVNVSSIYGFVTTPLTGWYQGSKHALEGLSDALRNEIASAGIDVVVVQPGAFRTNIWEEAERSAEEHRDSRYADAYRTAIDNARRFEFLMGDPVSVARTIVSALEARRPRSRYLVGTDARILGLVDPFVPTLVRDWIARQTFRT